MTALIAIFGRVLHLCEGLALKLSALLMLALLALMNVEIAARYLFGKSTLLADEYGGYFYAWIVLLGAVHLLRSDKYLTVTLLTDRLSDRGRNAAAMFRRRDRALRQPGVALEHVVDRAAELDVRHTIDAAVGDAADLSATGAADRLRPAFARLCRGNPAAAVRAAAAPRATTIRRPTASETSVELGTIAPPPRRTAHARDRARRSGRGRHGPRRHRRDHAAARHAIVAEPRRHHLEHRELVHAGRDSAVRADGRNHPAQRRGAALLHGPRGAAQQRAGRAGAVQHHGLRAVLGDLRIVDRDRADDRHRGAAGNAQARLQRQDHARHADRRRRARQSHSAQHFPAGLCDGRAAVGDRPVHRDHHPRRDRGPDVHGLRGVSRDLRTLPSFRRRRRDIHGPSSSAGWARSRR